MLPFSYPLLALIHSMRGEVDEGRVLVARMHEVAPCYSGANLARLFSRPGSGTGLREMLARVARGESAGA